VYNWSDGSPVDYSSWLYGQPDERYQSGSCVQATLQPGRMNWLFWEDVDCSPKLPYACAKLPSKLSLSHDDSTVSPWGLALFLMTTSFITTVHI